MSLIADDEFTRVELNRRIKVLEGLFEAYSGHVTHDEYIEAHTDTARRENIRDLLRCINDAARDAGEYAERLRGLLDYEL